MDNRRLLLAALLSLAVLIVWQVLFPPPEPPRQAPPPAPPGREEATVPGPGAEAEAPAAPGERREPAREPGAPVGEPLEARAEETLTVETPYARATFTNRGAQLLSFELREHRSVRGGPVDLVRARLEGPYPFALLGPGGEPSPLGTALFVAQREVGEGGATVATFRYRGAGGSAEKRFVFRPDGLLEVEVRAETGGDWGLLLGPGIRNPSLKELENRFAQRSAVYQSGQDLETIPPQKAEGPAVVPGEGLRWIGLEDTYFLTALILRQGIDRAVLAPFLVEPVAEGGAVRFRELAAAPEAEDLARDFAVLVYPGGPELRALAYLGPKQLDRLAALPYGLEKTVKLGMFGFLARPLLWGLQWIYANLIHNYGWGIILMTLLIKLLLFPLTHKSYVSMQKMQELNPKIQGIRQKYRGKLKDRQGRPNAEAQRKMNEEIMALYRQQGVNPAGGCLPMLLQIPVLFAFYRLLTTAIELRGADWMLWIHDLSAPDPYYVLPIVMGASQYLQQKLTPAAGDPMQRKIFLLMPVFFTVLFLGFPSGLVLYWLTNNLLTIAQQGVYNRVKQRRAAAAS